MTDVPPSQHNDPVPIPSWDLADARECYNIDGWGDRYFRIDEQGHARMVLTQQPQHPGVDLYELAQKLPKSGLELPVLVRFPNILEDRVDRLREAFTQAQQALGYTGGYTAVYPIKVNQQRSVISHILAHGGEGVGLEAGSKAELMAVLALSPIGGTIICNGYKDIEYIRLALIGRRLGLKVYLVIEKPSELETVIAQGRALGVRPLIGIRIRLASIGGGKWQNSGGEGAKFGLTAAQALHVVDRLRETDGLDDLQLLHFHMGSQIPNIRDIRRGVREAAYLYAQLRLCGAPIEVLDVGGGLGIDYEGTRSRRYFSVNYSLQEYLYTLLAQLCETCKDQALPHPHLITESGRSMTAHHAMLITQIVDSEAITKTPPVIAPSEEAPSILHELWRLYRNQDRLTPSERYQEAVYWFGESQVMFTHGLLDLPGRAQAEALYFATCQAVSMSLDRSGRHDREIADELRERLADKYFCNLSIFQSIPDVWGLGQVFPIMPLHRLTEYPDRHVVLHDLTCDSDGQLQHYISGPGIDTTLPLHSLDKGETYYIGIFLVGAYQEILGDMHNLFGDTNSVNVELHPQGYRLSEPEHGDTAEDVLRYVHFEPKVLMGEYRRKVELARLSSDQARSLLAELQAGLSGYTYLES